MINIDKDLRNADWPKRTPDVIGAIGVRRTLEASSQDETELLRLENKKLPTVLVALQYVFAQGRRAINVAELEIAPEAAAKAIYNAVMLVMPGTLTPVVNAGGVAGASLLNDYLEKGLRTAGGPGSGNFGHAGRPGQVGGSSDAVLPLPHKDWPSLTADSEYLYHATNSENASSIAEDELVAHRADYGTDQDAWPDGSRERRSYFIDSPAKAWAFAPSEGKPVLLRVRKDSAKFKRESTGDYYVTESISSAQIEVVADDKTWQALGGATLRTGAKKKKKQEGIFIFNTKNPQAAKWAKAHAAELADGLSETTLKAVRRAVADVFESGDAEKAYDRIFEAVGNADRAERIARTEILRAAHEGQRIAWEQAIDEELLTGKEQRVWIATEIGACPECEALDGQKTTLSGSYPLNGGDGPPLHPLCRCTEGISS